MKRWTIFLLGFVVISIVGYMAWNSEDGKQREIRIINEYQAIKHPDGASLIHYELKRKFIKRWIFSEYIYPIGNDDVKKYYDKELVGKGWQQISYNSRPGDVFYAYIKDNLRVVLGPHEENSWTISMSYVDATY